MKFEKKLIIKNSLQFFVSWKCRSKNALNSTKKTFRIVNFKWNLADEKNQNERMCTKFQIFIEQKLTHKSFLFTFMYFSTAPNTKKNRIKYSFRRLTTKHWCVLLTVLLSLSLLFNKLFLVQCFTNKSPYFRCAYSF